MASLDMLPDSIIKKVIEDQDAHLRDENADHLTGAPTPVKRADRRAVAGERIIRMIRAHGNGYRSAGAQLRVAAERHFGSWAKACVAAGIDPPKRGRPTNEEVMADAANA